MTSQEELAKSTRRELGSQAAAIEQLSEKMRSSNSRLNKKMDEHTQQFAETLAVLETSRSLAADIPLSQLRGS